MYWSGQIAVTLAALMFASMGIYSRHTMKNNADALAMGSSFLNQIIDLRVIIATATILMSLALVMLCYD